MPYRSDFFTAKETSPGVYDRTYSAEQFSGRFKKLFTNGIIIPGGGVISDELDVSVIDSTMKTSINPGSAIINGYALEVYTAPVELTHAAADPNNPRIDRVVLELNLTDSVRAILPKIVQGVPAISPEAPELTKTDTIYHLSLAQVLIPANVASLPADAVTDERSIDDVCGIANVAIGIKPNSYVLQDVFDAHLADFEYQTPTIVGTQIQIVRESATDRLFFYLSADLSGGAITISLDGGTSDVPLQDFDGNALTELSKGFVEVVDNTTFFTYAPKGGSIIKSIQRGSSLLDGGSTPKNITITGVDLSKSILIFNSYMIGRTTSTLDHIVVKGKLTTTTNIEFKVATYDAGGDTSFAKVDWFVIEFNDVKSVQRGDLTFNSGTINNAVTISSIDVTKSLAFVSCQHNDPTNSYFGLATTSISITDATHISINNGSANGNVKIAHWQVVEFN